MKKIYLYTSYDCLIKSSSQDKTVEKDSNIQLETSDFPVSIYPINKTKELSFKIYLQTKSNNKYRIIEKENKILIFLIESMLCEDSYIYNVSSKDNNAKIEVAKQTIIFQTSLIKKKIFLPTPINQIQCGHIKNFLYVKFQNNNQSNILTFNIDSNKIKIFHGNNISLNDNGFDISVEENNIYKTMTKKYIFNENDIKIQTTNFPLQSSQLTNRFIPYTFMYYIQNQDFINAYNLLDNDLKKTLSINKLRDFFGDITFFKFIDEQNCFAISNNQDFVYTFSISNNYILDISDDK